MRFSGCRAAAVLAAAAGLVVPFVSVSAPASAATKAAYPIDGSVRVAVWPATQISAADFLSDLRAGKQPRSGTVIDAAAATGRSTAPASRTNARAPKAPQLSPAEEEAIALKDAGKLYDRKLYNSAMKKRREGGKYRGEINVQKRKSNMIAVSVDYTSKSACVSLLPVLMRSSVFKTFVKATATAAVGVSVLEVVGDIAEGIIETLLF